MTGKESDAMARNLNSVSFYGCEDILIGDVLDDAFRFWLPDLTEWKTTLRDLFFILRRLLRADYKFSLCDKTGQNMRTRGGREEPETLFFFSRNVFREDMLQAFLNAAKLCKNRVEMLFSHRVFKFFGIRYLRYPLVWFWQMRTACPRLRLRIYLIRCLFEAFMDYELLKEQSTRNHWKFKNLVVLCDFHPADSFFVQRFNLENITTVGLQHGTYGMEFKAYSFCHSRYFLAESPYAAQCVQNLGYKGIPIVVGSPHNLGKKERNKPAHFRTDTIGVFLDGSVELPQYNNENIAMLTVVQDFCQKTGRKMLLKYHPTTRAGLYSGYVDSDITMEYGKETSAQEIGDKIDVAIVGVSTVLIVMLKQWVPTLLFQSENQAFDPNWYVDELKFSDGKGLERLFKWITTQEYYSKFDQYRSYFVPCGDTADNYQRAYERIGL